MDKSDAKILYNALIYINLQAKKMKYKKSAFIVDAKSRRKMVILEANSDTNATVVAANLQLASF